MAGYCGRKQVVASKRRRNGHWYIPVTIYYEVSISHVYRVIVAWGSSLLASAPQCVGTCDSGAAAEVRGRSRMRKEPRNLHESITYR